MLNDLKWNVVRPQGLEAVMRVRCSQVRLGSMRWKSSVRCRTGFTFVQMYGLGIVPVVRCSQVCLESTRSGAAGRLRPDLVFTVIRWAGELYQPCTTATCLLVVHVEELLTC